jgi:hypothetical protein
MANMGYCRFQNTLQDLQDCTGHMADTDLSKDEQRARRYLISMCQEILDKENEKEDEENET